MPKLTFEGGINQSDDFNVSPVECISGQNFLLDPLSKDLRPRPPQDLAVTAANAGAIVGILQFRLKDGTLATAVAAGNKVYEWTGGALSTELKTVNGVDPLVLTKFRGAPWVLDDLMVVVNVKTGVLSARDHVRKFYNLSGTGLLFGTLKTGLAGTNTQSVTSITRSGTTATVTTAISHNMSDGDLVQIAGADQTDYNGEFEVNQTSTTIFTMEVANSPTTPATGTITFTKSPVVGANYVAVHGGRVWLGHIKIDNTATKHMLLVSKFEEAESYDTSARNAAAGIGANDAFFMLTPDLLPINGIVEFLGQLVVSTEGGKLFKLTGSDATDYNWIEFYAGSAAVGTETLASVGNDVIFMRQGGNVELLSSTERFGDVAVDDVSRFIPVEVDGLTDAIVAYDQQRQRVLWFVTAKVLVLDKTVMLTKRTSPWTKFVTAMSNAFATSAAAYIEDPDNAGKFDVFWGDSAGKIYKVNGTGSSGDAGANSIVVNRKTRHIDEFPDNGEILDGRVTYKREGAVTLTATFDWSEEIEDKVATMSLSSATDSKISTVGFDVVGRGPGFEMTLAATTNVDFRIGNIILGDDGD